MKDVMKYLIGFEVEVDVDCLIVVSTIKGHKRET